MSSFQKKGNLNYKSLNKKRYEIIAEPIKNLEIFKKLNISICVHCANLDIFKELITYIKNFEEFEWNRLQILINIVIDLVDKDSVYQLIKNTFKKGHFIIIKSKNKGNDIGGFLRCYNYIKNDDHIIAHIHTKGRVEWRRGLMKIFTKEGIYNSIKLLHFEKIGMVGNNNQLWDFYKNENMSYKNYIHNICNILKLKFNEMNLHNGFLIGGTIFMCKKNIIENVIKNRDILYKHCNENKNYYENKNAFKFELTMERLFGYLVYHYKKNIVGLINN
tara:strand:- start:243 stop:1067 length:825 start_codon:yes stop_codon:yes gene_type:complete